MAPGVTLAQEAQPATPATEVAEIVITGTRLRVQDYSAPNPITTVTSEAIERSGETNLTEFLVEVPALNGSLTLQDGADTTTPGLAGLNLLELRQLGASRTLVLVDGRRHVAANPGTSSVDVNSIPVSLVERTEVLTGGASAVYGADGVSGVVNFILKKDFEGVDIRGQYGWSDEGGGGEGAFISGLVGHNFAGGRGNMTFGVEWAEDQALDFDDRYYTRLGNRRILINNPADPGTFGGADDPNIPDQILARNVRYIDTSREGSTYTNFNTAPTTSGVSFVNDRPFVEGEYAGGFFMIGGDGTLLDEFNDDLLPGLDRQSLSWTGRYEFSPRATLFGELKYTRSETSFIAQPSYFYGLFLHDENPFIPANVLADAQTPGGLANPADTFLPEPGVLLARDNFDLGRQTYDITRETYRGVVGLEGELTDNLRYEVSYVYGRSEQEQVTSNVLINDRVFAATDVVLDGSGNAVCRSNLDPSAVPYGDLFGQFSFPDRAFGATFTPGANSGCLPINLYGENQNSAAALDWITGEYTSNAVIDQHVVNGFISGDTTPWFNLPGGPIAFVLGAEYRKESSESIPSDIELLADSLEYPLTGVGRASVTEGSFDVREVFGEVSVPLLADLPFVRSLTLSAAYRYSDYGSDVSDAVDYQTDTWNVNGRWQINDSLALRATRARAVRAPNIVNLFQGRQQTFESFSDPCSVENLGFGENPALRQQNCAAELTALGVDPTTFINNSSEAVGGFITGNTLLEPETADTYTAGFVFTPTFLPGFSMALDYYDITIEDAIQSYDAQTIVNNCYDLPQPNQFCDLVDRGTVGGNAGRITSFDQVPGNIASYETAGYDLSIRYNFDLQDFGAQTDYGRFNLALVANKLEKLTFIEASGADPVDSLGRAGAPEWQATFDITWQYQGFSANYGYSWWDETNRYSQTTLENEPDVAPAELLKYPARSVHDIQLAYDVSDGFEVYGGVNNFTNQRPEPSSYDYPVSALGRFFYVGARARFDTLGSLLSWR